MQLYVRIPSHAPAPAPAPAPCDQEDIEWEQENQARLELVSDPRWIAEDDTPFEERLYNAHHQSSLTKAEENEQLYWLGDRNDVNEAT